MNGAAVFLLLLMLQRLDLAVSQVVQNLVFRIVDDGLVQVPLVPFERQAEFPAAIDDRGHDLFLAAHRVDRDDASLEFDLPQSSGMAVISLLFSSVANCPSETP